MLAWRPTREISQQYGAKSNVKWAPYKKERKFMAPVIFDVEAAKEKKQFSFTFGKSRETARWTQKRRFDFRQLAEFLSKSPAVGQKDGDCYTPALFSGHTRTLQTTTQIDVVVLDSDCGHDLDYIKRAVAYKGWRAIIHSTYSHLTEHTQIAAGAFYKWQSENSGKPIGQYLTDKKGFLPKIVEGSHIVDESVDGKTGNVLVKHAPCPKFRILLPLHKAWLAEDYDSQDLANAKWRERIGALAFAIGLHHDQSCVDTSRLFYFPRVRDEAAKAQYVCDVLPGEDCDLWSLPDAAPVASPMESLFDGYTANVVRLPARPEKKAFIDPATGEVFDLTGWVARYGTRFEIAKALQARAPHMLAPRAAGVKQHIYCARSGDHMTGGLEGTGTFVVNASELARAAMPSVKSGFVIHCSHNGCAGVDRLEHVRSLLAAGALGIADLTNPEFLTIDVFATVDISNIMSARPAPAPPAEKNEPKQSQTEYERDSSNINNYLLKDLPGMLGEIHKFICDTAPKPQPVLALGAALAFCASAIGQRVKLQHFGTRPNIYVLGIGVSGSGKDRPMTAVKQIARAAGLYNELIGVEEVASDSGIVTAVTRSPRQLMLIDEVSFLLNAVSDPRAGPHLTNVIGVLLKMYSSSTTTYQGKSYVDSEKTKLIDQPCVSFYGASTPAGLADALTTKDIQSGLLSRMVVFDAGENDPRIGIPKKVQPSQAMLDWLTAWNAVKPIPNIMAMEGGQPVIAPREVMLTDEALHMAMNFEGEMHAAKTKARKHNKDALYVRAFENALKFALIRACASIWPVANESGTGLMVDESALCVDAPIMRWAIDLSRATVARMVVTTSEIADTGYERTLKALAQAIRRGGVRGMTMGDLSRVPAGRMPSRSLSECLATMMDAREIVRLHLKAVGNGGKGRPREAFIHKDFFKELNVNNMDDDEGEAMAGE